MAFPKSIKTNWIVKSQAAVGKHSSELHPFEFAVLDKDTSTSLAPLDILNRDLLFAVGSPNVGQSTSGLKVERLHDQLNSTMSFKSQPVSRVTNVRAQKFTKDTATNVYYFGYNGSDTCRSLEFECGKTYMFDVYVKGRPARNIFFNELREVFEITTPCCAPCADGDCDTALDCSYVIDELVANFNDENRWTSRFFTAEKVMSCATGTPEALPQVDYTKYCLTVCDNGNELDLANIQAQYPASTVTRTERNGPYTTYELTLLESADAPADFSQDATTILGCDTCPSGFTEVAGGYAFVVEIDNSNTDTDAAAYLAAVQLVWATATSATKIGFVNGTSTYYIVASTDITKLPAADGRVTKSLGLTETKCTQDTAITTSWVECGSAYKVYRDLLITIGVSDCASVSNADELAAIQAFYADDPSIVADSLVAVDISGTTECLLRFSVQQLNNALLEDGCDTFAVAKFDTLSSYKGAFWKVDLCEGWTADAETGCPVPPVATDRCCNCGIKFTARSFNNLDQFLDLPIFDLWEYNEKDPVELSVSLLEADGTTQVCDDKQPDFIQTQRANYRTLHGRDVMKEILLERFYRLEPYWNLTDKDALLLQAREGLKYGVDINSYYNAITVSHNVVNNLNYNSHTHSLREDVVLYFHEDDVVLYEAMKGQFAAMFPAAKFENS